MKRFGLTVAGLMFLASLGFAAPREDVNLSVWRINGEQVTATAAELDAAADGTAPLASNKVFIGSSSGAAAAQTLSGEATITTGGVVSVDLDAHGVALDELPALVTGEILVGDDSDSNANAVAMSGEATVDATGAVSVDLDAHGVALDELPELVTGEILVGDDSDSNANAVAMSGEATIDATGAVSVDLDAHGVALDELPELVTGEILVGDDSDSNANAVAMSGEATIDAAGAVSVDLDAHGVALDELPALTTGQVLVGDSSDSNANAVSMSGDATIDAAGALTIAGGAVEVSMATTALKTKCAVTDIGSISASDEKYVFIAPYACTVVGCGIVCDTTTVTSDATSNYTFQVVNLTQTANLADEVTSTEDTEITGDAFYSILATQNLTLVENDVLELDIDLNNDATDLSSAEILFMIEYQ